MMQSNEILGGLVANGVGAVFRTDIEAAKRGATILAKNATNYFANNKINKLNKKFATTSG